jgi:two-component system sensor histidine kinase SenX3
VRLAVSDSGVGIPAPELERIFDKFHQVKRTREGSRPGSGLGLPISRQLVEMHGGSLTAQSAQGKGSTFTVVLPVSAELRRSAEGVRDTWHAS